MMTKKRSFIFILFIATLVLGFAQPLFSQAVRSIPPLPVQGSPRDLNLIDVGKVVEVLKSDTIRVGKDRKIYKLDNLRIPLQMNMAARDYLEEQLNGKTVGIYISGDDVNARKTDLGHVLCHIMTQDGKWLQAELVSQGYAYVTSTATSRDLVRTLYKYEELARARKIGLWQYDKYDIKNNATLNKQLNTFNIYEGVVTATRDDSLHNIFLSFGRDSKTDVTAIIKGEHLLRFSLPNALSPLHHTDMKQRHIRIRGWFIENDGPLLVLDHPEQIEFPGVHGAIPIP